MHGPAGAGRTSQEPISSEYRSGAGPTAASEEVGKVAVGDTRAQRGAHSDCPPGGCECGSEQGTLEDARSPEAGRPRYL